MAARTYSQLSAFGRGIANNATTAIMSLYQQRDEVKLRTNEEMQIREFESWRARSKKQDSEETCNSTEGIGCSDSRLSDGKSEKVTS